MARSTKTPNIAAHIPATILFDRRLTAAQKLLIAILPYLPTDSEGRYIATSVDLAHFMQGSQRTALNAVDNAAKCGYLEVKKSKGYKGGLRIRFLNASLLAALLLLSNISSANQGSIRRLHNGNYEPELARTTDYNRRRRRQVTGHVEADAALRRELDQLRDSFGQQGLWIFQRRHTEAECERALRHH